MHGMCGAAAPAAWPGRRKTEEDRRLPVGQTGERKRERKEEGKENGVAR
jgi:hypothetical protein